MADEPIKPNPPVDTAALMAEVEALRKSNREILDDYKKAKEAVSRTKWLGNTKHSAICTRNTPRNDQRHHQDTPGVSQRLLWNDVGFKIAKQNIS